MENQDVKRMTLKLPVALWSQLRRLQEAGKIKSLQDGVLKAVAKFVEPYQEDWL